MSTSSFGRRWLTAPVLATEELTVRARTFQRVILTTMFTLTFFPALSILEDPSSLARRGASILCGNALALAMLFLNSRGRTRLASWLFIGGSTCIISVRAWTLGGVDALVTAALVIMVVMGGVLLGTVGGRVVAAACASITLFMAVAKVQGFLPPPQMQFTPIGAWLSACIWLALAVSLQEQISIALREALRRTQTELSQRKQAEQRLRLALDAGNISFWDQDLDTKSFHADHRAHGFYGISPAEKGLVPYESWSERVHPDDLPEAESALRALESGARHAHVNFRTLRPSGEERFIEASATAVLDEAQRVHIVGVNVDVTERREAQLERESLLRDLRERLKELRLLHAAAKLLQQSRSTGTDLFREIVALMPAAWQYPECCEARITFREVVVATPGWRESEWRQSKIFETEEGSGVIDVVYVEPRPQAAEGPFLAEERALLDSLAEMLVAYVELRRHQKGLEELVAARTQELSSARDDANRANSAKSVFLANMSHEIRTPMNAVLGYAQLLIRDRSLSESQRRKLDAILSSGTHLLTVINDVLEMSKIEAGRIQLVHEVMDLHAILFDIEQMFAVLMRDHGVELHFERDQSVPKAIRGDAQKIRQVLINLLSNALKFTERGSVHVHASVHALSETALRITIDVVDTGAGIDVADQARIFGTFEQSDQGMRAGGSGLGLSISRNFARLMQGDLTVKSRLGEGSTFSFSFEVETRAASELAVQPANDGTCLPVGLEPDCVPPRVLIVEDRPENRALLAELLTNVGFEVRTADQGEDGIVVHDAWLPHLVLMDLRMPGMGGVEAIRRLRAGGSRVVIVALTGSAIDGTKREALEVGANDVILKPYVEQTLLERIGSLLELRYVYRPRLSHAPAREVASGIHAASIASQLAQVPQALLVRLRDAAISARTQRIEQIAEEIATASPTASSAIVTLVREFRYDVLVAAVEEVAPELQSTPPLAS